MNDHLVRDALNTGPAAEDEGVVGREDVDGVDALALELVVLRGVWREVVGVARRLCDIRASRQIGMRRSIVDRRTVKAPGTAKITTFLPLNASVVSFEAVGWDAGQDMMAEA